MYLRDVPLKMNEDFFRILGNCIKRLFSKDRVNFYSSWNGPSYLEIDWALIKCDMQIKFTEKKALISYCSRNQVNVLVFETSWKFNFKSRASYISWKKKNQFFIFMTNPFFILSQQFGPFYSAHFQQWVYLIKH